MQPMNEDAHPRATPCASCPYRKTVPSGIWHPEEYDKLRQYDGDMAEQTSIAAFYCHQGTADICAGWLGHRDPADMLAVRVGIIDGRLNPACAEYTTDVPLFESGTAAADHGMADITAPTPAAAAAIAKITRVRSLTGDPVQLH